MIQVYMIFNCILCMLYANTIGGAAFTPCTAVLTDVQSMIHSICPTGCVTRRGSHIKHVQLYRL